jgi:hypothetical protein
MGSETDFDSGPIDMVITAIVAVILIAGIITAFLVQGR